MIPFWAFRSPRHYVVQDLQRRTKSPISEAAARRLWDSAQVLVRRQTMESYYARLRLADGSEVILWANPWWTRP